MLIPSVPGSGFLSWEQCQKGRGRKIKTLFALSPHLPPDLYFALVVRTKAPGFCLLWMRLQASVICSLRKILIGLCHCVQIKKVVLSPSSWSSLMTEFSRLTNGRKSHQDPAPIRILTRSHRRPIFTNLHLRFQLNFRIHFWLPLIINSFRHFNFRPPRWLAALWFPASHQLHQIPLRRLSSRIKFYRGQL